MVKVKKRVKTPTSRSKPKKNDATNNAEMETVASELVKGENVSVGEEKREDNTKEEKKNKEKVENTPDKKGNKSRKRKRKKEISGVALAVATKDSDKPEASNRMKKIPKKVDSMGMIFMCSSKTKKDCYSYKVFGLPASKKETVAKIYKGMRLFLFDIDLKLMYGIYKAAGPGGHNIEPKAFKSAFPSQVRFTILEDCLPLAEEKFKPVIKDNYYGKNKFHCQLKSEQVKNLCNLFRATTTKSSKSKQVDRSSRRERHTFIDRGRDRRRGLDEVRDRDRNRWRHLDEERDRDRERRRQLDEVRDRDRDRWRHVDEVRDRDRDRWRHVDKVRDQDRDGWLGLAGVSHPQFGGDHVFSAGLGMHHREAFVPPVLPLPLPAPLPPPSYVYERPLEYYRVGDPQLERHERGHLGLLRHEEISFPDPYVQRELPPFREPLYPVGPTPVYHPPPPPMYRY